MIQKQDDKPPVNPFEDGSRESLREEKPPVNPFEDAEEPAEPPTEFAPVVNRPKTEEKVVNSEENESTVNAVEDEKRPMPDDDEEKNYIELATSVKDRPRRISGRVAYSTEPISVICEKCKKTVISEIRNVPSWKNRMAAQLLCHICCCCLSPCAYCDKDLQEKKHYCPDCHSFLGIYAKKCTNV